MFRLLFEEGKNVFLKQVDMLVLCRVSQYSLINQAADMNSKSRMKIYGKRGILAILFVLCQMLEGVSGFLSSVIEMLVKELAAAVTPFYSR